MDGFQSILGSNFDALYQQIVPTGSELMAHILLTSPTSNPLNSSGSTPLQTHLLRRSAGWVESYGVVVRQWVCERSLSVAATLRRRYLYPSPTEMVRIEVRAASAALGGTANMHRRASGQAAGGMVAVPVGWSLLEPDRWRNLVVYALEVATSAPRAGRRFEPVQERELHQDALRAVRDLHGASRVPGRCS